MRSITRPFMLAAVATAATFSAVSLAVPTAADAAPRRSVEMRTRYIYYDRAPSRIVVRKRSFLDPGREPLPNTQHYHDYAFSPSYTVFPKFFDYSYAPGSGVRAPLPDTFDLPGYRRY